MRIMTVVVLYDLSSVWPKSDEEPNADNDAFVDRLATVPGCIQVQHSFDQYIEVDLQVSCFKEAEVRSAEIWNTILNILGVEQPC
jgi:hypothetical protein